ncbi:MAG TPA: hypothetical protein VGD67_00195, partial [Pseudonocardiaceae bacterium]
MRLGAKADAQPDAAGEPGPAPGPSRPDGSSDAEPVLTPLEEPEDPARRRRAARALPVVIGVLAAVLLLVGWQLMSARTVTGNPTVNAADHESRHRDLAGTDAGQLAPDTAGPAPAPTSAPPP